MNKSKQALKIARGIFVFILVLLCNSCVIPFLGDIVSVLAVVPRKNAYMIGDNFSLSDDLFITAISTGGTTVEVPAEAADIDFDDDFSFQGERVGTVVYGGQSATFSIYVYDPGTVGGPNGPTLIIQY